MWREGKGRQGQAAAGGASRWGRGGLMDIAEIEYVYRYSDGADGQFEFRWIAYRIAKRTKAYVFVVIRPPLEDVNILTGEPVSIPMQCIKLDRAELEREGASTAVRDASSSTRRKAWLTGCASGRRPPPRTRLSGLPPSGHRSGSRASSRPPMSALHSTGWRSRRNPTTAALTRHSAT